MSDEPTPSELGRLISTLQRTLDNFVGQREYAVYQTGIEHRLADLSRDVDEARAGIRAVNDRLDAEAERKRQEKEEEERRKQQERHAWRNAVWVGLLPAGIAALVGVAGILVTLWITSHGGAH